MHTLNFEYLSLGLAKGGHFIFIIDGTEVSDSNFTRKLFCEISCHFLHEQIYDISCFYFYWAMINEMFWMIFLFVFVNQIFFESLSQSYPREEISLKCKNVHLQCLFNFYLLLLCWGKCKTIEHFLCIE